MIITYYSYRITYKNGVNRMIEILWLGRGGQGAFTAAKLLGAAYASTDQERYSLAFPSFGPERRGAPVRAFTKLDDAPILDRSETSSADYIVILDDTLYTPALLSQLKANGKILINTKHAPEGCTAIDGTPRTALCSGIARTDFPRLQSGLVRQLHSADLCGDDRCKRRHGLLCEVLLRFW